MRALTGLAAHAAAAGRHDLSLVLATRVLADEASKGEVRRSAAELQRGARAQLAAEAVGPQQRLGRASVSLALLLHYVRYGCDHHLYFFHLARQ
jgi:hypothetical protein